MPRPIQDSSHLQKTEFPEDWWREFGVPVACEGTTLDDRYWIKVGEKILHLSPALLGAMLLVLVFDEERDRARRGLDHLRSQYRNTHPALASMWGNKQPGRQLSLSKKQCIAIRLAIEFGIKKTRILRVTGLVDEHFDSGADRSKYALIDRAANEGKRSPLFVSMRERLQTLKPTERERQIFTMLKPTSKLIRSKLHQPD